MTGPAAVPGRSRRGGRFSFWIFSTVTAAQAAAAQDGRHIPAWGFYPISENSFANKPSSGSGFSSRFGAAQFAGSAAACMPPITEPILPGMAAADSKVYA